MHGGKWDPRLYNGGEEMALCNRLLACADAGDLVGMKTLHHLGVSLDTPDYDLRTAAHLAASSGRCEVLKYLRDAKANLKAVDRWGSSPLEDAERGDHKDAFLFLCSVNEDENAGQATSSGEIPVDGT